MKKMSRISIGMVCTIAALSCTSARAAEAEYQPPALPQIPKKVFSIAEHGSAPGTDKDNAKAIQDTIDAASAAGGGVVEIPTGEYLTGPFHMANNIDVHLADNTVLKMLPMGRYPAETRKSSALIQGAKLHDVAITGKGTIDGQGSPWWPLAKTDQQAVRPRMIALSGCDRVLIEDVKLMNSPMFHIAISGGATDVTVRKVTIRAPASTDKENPSHNTDACDVSGKHVLVEDCDVSVGDDDFTCGGGTSDVLIRHCTYGYGHGVSIGSPIAGGVSNITVEDCTFTNTECGIRIKSDRDRGGVVEHMVYKNLKMTNVNMPILIYGSYMAKEKEFRDLNHLTGEIAAKYPAAPMGNRTPVYKDFLFSNITATAAKGARAGLIFGLPEAPAENIVFENVDITADGPFGIFNAKGVKFENCKIVTPDGVNKLTTANADISIKP